MNLRIKMEKIAALMLVGILLIGTVCSAENTSLAQTEGKVPGKVYNNGTYEYKVLSDGKSVRLYECTKAIGEKTRKVVLPKEIDGLPIKELGRECMGSYYRDRPESLYIREVVIPNGIEHIREDAFLECRNLERIHLGDTVSKIDNSAFYHCDNLKSVEGGKSVKFVGRDVFGCCNKMTKVPKFWSTSKHKIEHGYATFRNCGIKNVTIPTWETEVSAMFYEGCKNLRKVTFTKGQKYTVRKAFNECKNLREVKFCFGLESITDRSFRWCEKLKKATLPKTTEEICWKAFQHCRSLEKVSLPNSLENIYDMAFQDCRSLKQIKIPKKVKRIYPKTFQGCKNLKKAVIPKSVKKIDKTAFGGCKKLVIHCQKGSYAHKYAKKHHIRYQLMK